MALNHFYKVIFNEEKREVSVQWTSQTKHMGREEFRDVLNEILNALKKYEKEVYYYTADTRHFAYTLDESDQKWANTHFLDHLPPLGIHHFAIIISPDIFAQISIKQTMELVDPNSGLTTRYFERSSDAHLWFEHIKVKS